MISKRTFVVVVGSIAAMTLLACQKSFNMTCDPANPSKSVCAPGKSQTVNTVFGAVSLSVNSALAIPMSQDGAGSNGGLQMNFTLSGERITTRQINLNVPAAGNGTGNVQTQANEPVIRYAVKCSGTDPTCATMDVGLYIEVSAQETKVYAIRVNGSSILMTSFLPVGGNVINNDPTSALTAYPSI